MAPLLDGGCLTLGSSISQADAANPRWKIETLYGSREQSRKLFFPTVQGQTSSLVLVPLVTLGRRCCPFGQGYLVGGEDSRM